MDLEELADYLGERNPSAADRVIEELDRSFDAIAGNRESGTSLDDLRSGLRVFVPSKPAANYLVFYYLVPDGVVISDVVHASRDWIGMFSRHER